MSSQTTDTPGTTTTIRSRIAPEQLFKLTRTREALQINVSAIPSPTRGSPPYSGTLNSEPFSGHLEGGRSLSFRISGGDSNNCTRDSGPTQIHPPRPHPHPKNPRHHAAGQPSARNNRPAHPEFRTVSSVTGSSDAIPVTPRWCWHAPTPQTECAPVARVRSTRSRPVPRQRLPPASGPVLANRAPDEKSRSLWEMGCWSTCCRRSTRSRAHVVLQQLLGSWQDKLFGLAAIGSAVIASCRSIAGSDPWAVSPSLGRCWAGSYATGPCRRSPTAGVGGDDALIARAGGELTAHVVVLESGGLEADESLLTGESDAVGKEAGTEIQSGSISPSGRGTARDPSGADSFASRLTAEANRFPLANSGIRDSLDRILGQLTGALLPAARSVTNGEMQSRKRVPVTGASPQTVACFFTTLRL